MGQRGDGTSDSAPHPSFAAVRIPHAAAVHTACGLSFALALLEDYTVVSWGAAEWLGRTGDSEVPLPVEGLRGVKHLYAGGYFAFAVLHSGEVFAWGRNSYGQLCLGRVSGNEQTPQRVAELSGRTVSLALSDAAGVALLAEGIAVAWGKLDGRMAHDGSPDEGRARPGRVTAVICTLHCTRAEADGQWAICGDAAKGLPFYDADPRRRLTPVPVPWVPFPKQIGCQGRCIFYTGEGAAAPSECEAALATANARILELEAALAAATDCISRLQGAAAAAGPAQPWPTLVSFERSNFRRIYDRCTPDQYENVFQIDLAVNNVFAIISEERGSSTHNEFRKMHNAMLELTAVRDGVEHAATRFGNSGNLTARERSERIAALTHNPITRACVYWTAGKLFDEHKVSRCAKIEGREMEFCGMLNWMIRTDREDILTAIMPFIRALCCYTNTERTGSAADVRKQWEMVKDITEMGTDAQGEPIRYKTLYRGGSLKSDCLPFFVPGTCYRAQGFLATSPNREKTEYFIKRTCDTDGRCKASGFEPVLWKFLVDGERHCMHATYIERSLLYEPGGEQPGAPSEAEFLFAGYSWFKVCNVYRGNRTMQDPTVITVRCAVDNTKHPADAPTSPWN